MPLPEATQESPAWAKRHHLGKLRPFGAEDLTSANDPSVYWGVGVATGASAAGVGVGATGVAAGSTGVAAGSTGVGVASAAGVAAGVADGELSGFGDGEGLAFALAVLVW